MRLRCSVVVAFAALCLVGFATASEQDFDVSHDLSERSMADGCTAIIVGKKASKDNSPMTTHTADCNNCDFRLAKVPARDFKPGAMHPVYPVRLQYPRFVGYDRGEAFHPDRLQKWYPWNQSKPIGYVPEVAHTYAYIDGLYGIMNEHQLAFGESTCGAKLWAVPIHAGGRALFDVSELSRIGMQRCKTARCAIQTMGDLAVEFGYYGAGWDPASAQSMGGETLTITDTEEAWVFHICADDTGSSAVWVAQRVPDDHIAVVSNGFTIRTVDLNDKDRFMASPNIEEVAYRAKLWDASKGPIDFMAAYAQMQTVYHEEYVARRWWRVLSKSAPSAGLKGYMNSYALPFSVKPDALLSVNDIFDLNRDHFEGTPYDMTQGVQAGPFGNPNRYDMYLDATREIPPEIMLKGHFERPISLHRTVYSFVTQSRSYLPDIVGARVWLGLHAPHSTCYVPFYPSAFDVAPSFTYGSLHGLTKDSAWWAFAAVGNYLERAYRHIIVDVAAEFGAIEAREFAEAAEVENKAVQLLGEESSDGMSARALLTSYSIDNAERVVSHWWDLLFRLIGKYHDGIKVVDPHQETLLPYKLFFPRFWLQAINWWHQPPEDDAAKEPEPVIPPFPEPIVVAAPAAVAPHEMAAQPPVLGGAGHVGVAEGMAPHKNIAGSQDGWALTIALFSVAAFAAGTAFGRFYFGLGPRKEDKYDMLE